MTTFKSSTLKKQLSQSFFKGPVVARQFILDMVFQESRSIFHKTFETCSGWSRVPPQTGIKQRYEKNCKIPQF